MVWAKLGGRGGKIRDDIDDIQYFSYTREVFSAWQLDLAGRPEVES
jgi:hypothetical protein